MKSEPPLSEISLQKRICKFLQDNRENELKIVAATSRNVRSLADLIEGRKFSLYSEDQKAEWRRCPEMGVDIVGGSGTTPDIILSSDLSKQQRIIIEAKKWATFTHKEPPASQVARYFLYLLYATLRYPLGKNSPDIRRAVLLVAPTKWFESKKADIWRRSVCIHSELAQLFDITFGEIHEDDLPPS
jgi:hypothetical protein